MEIKETSKRVIVILLTISVFILLPQTLSACHLAKYCSTAEDAAALYLKNEQLFLDCQTVLVENAEIVKATYVESLDTVFCDQLYFETKHPVESESLTIPAVAINRLNAKVPLISVFVARDLSEITFLINSMNFLNSAVIIYSADGTFPDKYIADLKQINANWAAYITNG